MASVIVSCRGCCWWVGSVASPAANVAVAEPTLIGRVIAAWPSFALTASFELLTRQVRCGPIHGDADGAVARPSQRSIQASARSSTPALPVVPPQARNGRQQTASDLHRQAWQWALANRGAGGVLPSGEEIARAHGRKERWGRLVKSAGQGGAFGQESRPVTDSGMEACR
jgi:hypothetical protein